jgi:hypothetical protein
MFSRATLLTLIVAGSPGCAKPQYGMSAPTDVGMTRADADDYDHAGAYEADGEAMPASAIRERQADFSPRRKLAVRSAPRSEMATPAPASDDHAPAADRVPPSDTAEPAIEAPEHDPHDRQIVYTASMNLSVFNLEEATKKAEALPESHGGYIHAMSRGHMVMRIPSKQLRPAMDELASLGVVEQRSLQAQDVTAEYVDIDARIRVLEETQKQMIELLGKARTVDEALAVRKALDQITMELEVLKGRMRQLQNMVSFSTLTVSLVERGPHVVTPSSRDPFPWVDDLGVEATEWK